jgi:hypothetical protein
LLHRELGRWKSPIERCAATIKNDIAARLLELAEMVKVAEKTSPTNGNLLVR